MHVLMWPLRLGEIPQIGLADGSWVTLMEPREFASPAPDLSQFRELPPSKIMATLAPAFTEFFTKFREHLRHEIGPRPDTDILVLQYVIPATLIFNGEGSTIFTNYTSWVGPMALLNSDDLQLWLQNTPEFHWGQDGQIQPMFPTDRYHATL